LNAEIEIKKLDAQKQAEIDRQKFASITRTEEEITAEKERQDQLKLESEIKFQIARLKIQKQFAKSLTKAESDRLDKEIELLETKLAGIGVVITKEAEKSKGLGALLGLDAEDSQKVNQATQQLFNESLKITKQFLAERQQQFADEIAERDNRIDDLNTQLQSEIKLAELGKASNIKAVQDQLEEQRVAREKAIQEQKRIAQIQFAIDTATQASSLVTAIANIYKSLSGIQPIGLALATALTGVLISGFIASKAVVAQSVGFSEGGYTGDTITGGREDVAGVVHKGEFVLDKPTTQMMGLRNKSMKDFHLLMHGKGLSDKKKGLEAKLEANKRLSEAKMKDIYKNAVKEAILGQSGLLQNIENAIYEIPVVLNDGRGNSVIERRVNGSKKTEIRRLNL
jgi:hypothetical protein